MRKLFKKSLACCLALALCFSLFAGAISANALTTNPAYSTEDVTVAPGESTTIKFTIKDFAEIQGVILKVYVPSVVASIDAVTVDGIELVEWSDETGEGNYQVDNENKFIKFMTLANFEGVDNVAALTFDIKVTVDAKAEAGEYGYTAPVIQATDGDVLVTINGQFGKFTVEVKEPEVHEHSWSDWNVVTEATTSANGSKTRTCDGCGETETKVIPRKLKLNSVAITLEEFIAVGFIANADHFGTYGYTDPYVKVINPITGNEELITEYTVDSKNRLVFTVLLTPQRLAESLQVYLYATNDGEEYCSDLLEYSIASSYCRKQLNNTSSTALKKLLVDLLEYGSALQTYRGYNTSNLANSILTAEEKALATPQNLAASSYADSQNAKYAVIDSPTAAFKTASLFLADSVETHLKVTLPADISNIKLVAIRGTSEPFEIPSSEFEWVASESRYLIKFKNTMAHQMDDVFYYTIYDGDTAISNTLAYSAESYVNRNIEKTNSDLVKLRPVMATMINYGRSADNYRASK